jgi:hypothetical protein
VIVDGGIGIADGLYVNGTTYAQNFSTANALITGGDIYDLDHLASANGAVLTFTAANFSSANTWLRGGVIGMSTDGTVQPASNIYVITQYAGNFSTPNAVISGGSITGVSFSGITLPSLADVQISNAFITSGAIGMAADGTTSAVANVYAGTGQFTNLSTANALITGADITTAVVTNFSTANALINGGNIILSAGTATKAPLKLNSGTNLTSVEAGAVEYDGTGFYATQSATTGRGLIPATQYFYLNANNALNNGTSISAVPTVQYSAFGGPVAANNWTGNIAVAAGVTYEIDGKFTYRYGVAGTGLSGAGTVLGWNLGLAATGAATLSSYSYVVRTMPGPVLGASQGLAIGATVANSVSQFGEATPVAIGAPSTIMTAHTYHSVTVEIRGHVKINAGGNLVMGPNWITVAPTTVTALRGSYLKLTPVSSAAGNAVIGAWTSGAAL